MRAECLFLDIVEFLYEMAMVVVTGHAMAVTPALNVNVYVWLVLPKTPGQASIPLLSSVRMAVYG